MLKKSKIVLAKLLTVTMAMNMAAPAYAAVPGAVESEIEEAVQEAEVTEEGLPEETVEEEEVIEEETFEEETSEEETSEEETAKEETSEEKSTEETVGEEESQEEEPSEEENVSETEETTEIESTVEETVEETAQAGLETVAAATIAESEEGYLEEQHITMNGKDLPKNEELLNHYVENLFYGNQDDFSPYGNYGETTVLTKPLDGYLYTQLKNAVIEIANGERTSAEISIDIDHMVWDYNQLNNRVPDAINIDADTIMKLLLVNCPYELYWFDKSVGVSISGISFYFDEMEKKATTLGDITFTLSVAAGYQDGDAVTVDNTKVQVAKQAAENAQSIVEAHSNDSDYEKYLAYKNEICDLVEYNTDAAEDSSTPYGDPWQLVYVFDKDDSTTVVCEGYSKAFQYLCDLSDLTCYTVRGTMSAKTSSGSSSGAHMWNIVTLEENNYLVDVTNCDGNDDSMTIGYPDHLFLAGAAGSVSDGIYRYHWSEFGYLYL